MAKKMIYPVVHVLCGFLGWGLMVGEITCLHPDVNPVYLAGCMAIAGPAGLGVATLISAEEDFLGSGAGIHFRVRPLTYEQRWAAFHEEYPSLSHYYFDHHGHEQEDEHCVAVDVTGCK